MHIGASLGNEGPELGGRLGARFRLAPNFGLSVFADAQASRTRVAMQCFGRWWECASDPYTAALFTAVARLEFISEGRLGPLLVPRFTAGVFVGGGVGVAPAVKYQSELLPEVVAPFMRVGLHLGFTRLPSGWWFPFFLDLGTICTERGCGNLNFVAGIGL